MHRHLRTLVEQGYVVQADDSDKYKAGVRLIGLGRLVSQNTDLAAIARDIMFELRDRLGVSVVISQMERDKLRVLSSLLGTSAIEIGVRHGSILSFHSTGQGKVALAFGDPALAERVIGGRLEMMTPFTIASPTALLTDLQQIRARGWATSPNQTMLGMNTLAAPIFDGSDQLVGTIAILDSIQFIEEQPSAVQIAQVTQAAAKISSSLGRTIKTVSLAAAVEPDAPSDATHVADAAPSRPKRGRPLKT